MCTLQIFNSNDSRVYNISSENIDIDSNNASIKDLNKLIHKSLGFKTIKTVISDDTTRCVNVCDLTNFKTNFVASNEILYDITKEYILRIYEEDRKYQIFNLLQKYDDVQVDCFYNDIQSSYKCNELEGILKIDLQINDLKDFEFIKKLISEMYDEKPSFEYETIHDEYGRITNEYDKNYFRLKSKINFKNCPEEFGENVLGFVLKRKGIYYG